MSTDNNKKNNMHFQDDGNVGYCGYVGSAPKLMPSYSDDPRLWDAFLNGVDARTKRIHKT